MTRNFPPRATRLLAVLSLLGFLGACALPGGEKALGPNKRPKYGLLRQNEDWSVMKEGVQDHDAFDSIKYVPLKKDGSVWASFGGSARARVENWGNFNFGAPPGVSHDDTFVVSRVLAHADVHFGERFRVFAEGKTAQATDRDLPGGRRPLDLDTLALQQLFFDFVVPLSNGGKLTFRPGRQMLLFGAQRLISPLPWGNTLRTWEGLTVELARGAWTVTGLATYFVPVDKTDGNERDEDQPLFGVYAKRTEGPKAGTEVYLLGNERKGVTVNGTTGNARRATLGVRRWAPLRERFDYEVEASYQNGEIGANDVCAWSFAGKLGYKPDPDGSLATWLGLDWASGDDGAGGDVGTFDQLYPLGHAYFGWIDTIGRQNIVDGSLGASWKAHEDVSLAVVHHAFWLDSRDDALYNAGGGVVRAPGSFGSSFVGNELDANATWKPDRHNTVQLGAARFFAGSAIEDSGPSEDINFVYLSLSTSF